MTRDELKRKREMQKKINKDILKLKKEARFIKYMLGKWHFNVVILEDTVGEVYKVLNKNGINIFDQGKCISLGILRVFYSHAKRCKHDHGIQGIHNSLPELVEKTKHSGIWQ